MTRETSFLFSLRISEPVGKKMKTIYGDNKIVDCGSTFLTGVIGSLCGHPADTALTLWQKGMKIENFKQSMRGGAVRAVTVGVFSIGYQHTKSLLKIEK